MLPLIMSKEAADAYNGMKMKRTYRWIIYKVKDEKEIVIEATGEPGSTFDKFIEKMPTAEPRYAMYDLEVTHSDGRKESKLLLILYSPDSSPAKNKFVYAAGKDSFKKVIGSVAKEFQVLLFTCTNEYSDA